MSTTKQRWVDVVANLQLHKNTFQKDGNVHTYLEMYAEASRRLALRFSYNIYKSLGNLCLTFADIKENGKTVKTRKLRATC